MTLKLPRLNLNNAIADQSGKPTTTFQRWWQSSAEAIEKNVTQLATQLGLITTAQGTADAAKTAAANAVFMSPPVIPPPSLALPVSVANGGTGQNAYTNGQLLIGRTSDGSLVPATITAGANITVTNGAGSVTIAASGGGGGGSGGAALTKPLAANFTAQNLGTATITDGTAAVIVTMPGTGFAFFEQTPPGSTFNAYMRIVLPDLTTTNGIVGFMARNSTSGKLMILGNLIQSSNYTCIRYSNSTGTFASTGSSKAPVRFYSWVRLEVTATNVNLYQSENGYDWTLMITDLLSAHLTTGVDRVGFIGSYTVASSYNVQSWSFTAPV